MVAPKEPAEPYKPPPEFKEVQVEPLVEEALSDTTELWLIQMPLNQLDAANFKGKQLSLKLPEGEGWMGCLENSKGKSYDMYCLGSQGMEPFAFLPRSKTSMGVRKIARHICLLSSNMENGDATRRTDTSAGISGEAMSQGQGRSVGSVGQKSSQVVSGITSERGEPLSMKRGKSSKDKGQNGTPTASHSKNLEENEAYDSSMQQGHSHRFNAVSEEPSTGGKKKKRKTTTEV